LEPAEGDPAGSDEEPAERRNDHVVEVADELDGRLDHRGQGLRAEARVT
jgi:hypothetical protein